MFFPIGILSRLHASIYDVVLLMEYLYILYDGENETFRTKPDRRVFGLLNSLKKRR